MMILILRPPSTPPALLISSFASSAPLLELMPKVASLPVRDANSPTTISCARSEEPATAAARIGIVKIDFMDSADLLFRPLGCNPVAVHSLVAHNMLFSADNEP